jgi:hypothetical protein
VGKPLLIKNYVAEGAIGAGLITRLGSTDAQAAQASGSSLPLLGVAVEVGAASGERVDIVFDGIADVTLGGTVTRGAQLTSDGQGRAVAATLGTGTVIYTVGMALASGVVGDIIPMLVQGNAIDSALTTTDVTISSAQLLALNATPQTLVPAPGAGRALIFMGAQLHLPAGTAYGGIAAGEDLSFKYTNAAGAAVAQVEATGFLDQATAQSRYVHPAAAADINPVANAPLVLHMLTGEITTGTSPLKVRVFTRTVDLVLP